MLDYFLISCLLLYAEGRPNDRRFRRDDDVAGVTYAPCKDTYNQCPEWKKSGMCEMPQYKDYMPLVCTDTCGFCKVKGEDTGGIGAAANKDVEETTKVEASSDTAQKDRIQEDYEAQLKKYYQNLESQQKEYQAAMQPQPQPAPSNTEQGTSNSAVSSPSSPDVAPLAPSVSAEGTSMQPGTYLAYLPYQYGSQTYGSQPYPAYTSSYPAYAPPPEGGSSSSSSTQSGTSSSSSSSTDTSSGSSISVGLTPPSSINGTEGNISAVASDVSVLPSKVAPETPSLPALPPLLALPPISESLLVEDSSKSNTTNSAVEKETDDKQKAQQVADAKPYAPERESSSSSKKEGKRQRHKGLVKAEADRKIITEDQQTNEMTKSESKHLTATARDANLEDENNDDEGEDEEEEEGDQKMIKAFSNDPGKLQLSVKKKNMDSDLKVAKQQKAQQKSEKEKSSENEDAVFKHDEKSVSDGGSGAAGMEESVEDLNYITDFNPDDFDMDVADISRKDLIRLHDKRNSVQFPQNHPLFSRSGIQKARSEITAPTIIDATEEGVGDSSLTDASPKTKVHTKLKSSTNPAKKEEVSKKEESSGMPSEVQSKFFESTAGDDQDEDTEDAEDAEKKNKIKEDAKTKDTRKEDTDKKNKIKEVEDKKDATRKSKIKKKEISKRKDKISKHEESEKGADKKAEKKSKAESKAKPTIGMKSKISINFKKSETTVHEKSKVISTKSKVEEKKDKTSSKKENKKDKSEVNEFMSEKGDTAAVRNKEVVKKSSTAVTKKDIAVAEAPARSKGTLKKRTNDDDKAGETEATIADLSGAGSGEIDTDMLSGDSPSRSLVESGDNESEDEDDDDDEDFTHQRQNFQLHGDPEMVDLKPKETAEQPDLDDFPDKGDRASYTKGKQIGQKDVDKKNMSDDEPELDDIKIEELLNPKQETTKKKKKPANKEKATSKLKEGKISLVLQQNFNVLYEKKDSPSYQMLAGNIKKDVQKMITGTTVNDVSFSEVSVEGNPRQSGKTKANFNIKAPSNEWMKELLKLVDSGDIDGLRVIKGSLEIEEE